MFDKKFRKRTAAGGMAAVMLFSGLLSSAAYARDGWTETQFLNNPVEVRMREFSFSDKANQQALAAGSIPTGLGHELTMTHRKTPAEPFAYGKWWLSNEGGHAVKDAKVPLASDKSKTVKVDFSKAANHLLSCVQVHNGSVPGGAIPGVEGMTYPMIYGSQFFAIEAYLPTTNPNDYPAYILDHSASMGIENMKFYLLLMCMLHSYDRLTPEELKDDAHKTEYSMVCFEYTRLLENGVFTQRPESYITDWTHVVNQIKGDLLPSQYPNNNESPNAAMSQSMEQWFKQCWNDALFMSQFGYDISQGMEGPGAEQTNIYVSIPLTEAALGDDGMYHRTWDYSAMQNVNADVFNKNASISLDKSSTIVGGPGAIKVTNKDGKLDFAATSAEQLKDDMLAGMVFNFSESSSDKQIQPAMLISGRMAGVATDIQSIASGADGQPMFTSYNIELQLRPGTPTTTTTPGPDPDPDPKPDPVTINRYKHSETFNADYTVNLRKFDSETGQPLADSHWDILEAFDYSQVENSVLTGMENWKNETGSQFEQWDGWDYGYGNPEGDSGKDPCNLDDNITDENGLLCYNGSMEPAHTDTKTYVYEKGYCGGHPAKPEPEEDPETGEILNQDEIDDWEDEVETCKNIRSEGGYFCATAEKGYENGEDASGAESKKQLEDDRDQYYKEFISLTYEYSAKEIMARPGYTLHGTHTDDIPLEEKTVTSSQLKEFNGTYGGDVTKLPHKNGSASGENEGETEPADSANVTGISSAAPDTTVTLATVSEAEPENSYLTFLDTLEAEEDVVENEDVKETEEETEPFLIADLEIVNENENTTGYAVISTSSEADREDTAATTSEADGLKHEKESWFEELYEDVKELAVRFYEMLKGAGQAFVALFTGEDEEVRDISHPNRDSVTWLTNGQANQINPLKNDIVDHTFTVFDHRTEGEIHINKRDLDLNDTKTDQIDDYGQENGDGTLEGAVYGLFAASDIEHPDGHTDVVYQKDDLVAVATTDRNGDASFMTFTEAPGMDYNYETGTIVKRDTGWADAAPENLHKPQDDGDAQAQDNEQYVGYDSSNSANSLTDSEDGCEKHTDSHYHKKSSNQDGIEGLTGGHETYPISDNATNNGNCWIGRPLIADDAGTHYYVKELSRSEGYELSVTGKANVITNGKESWKTEASTMAVSMTNPTYNGGNGSIETTVTATNADGDIVLKVKTGPEASFATVYKTIEKYEDEELVITPVEVPVIGTEGAYITLNGKSIEAKVGDIITVNGKEYTVTQVSEPEQPLMGAVPANEKVMGVVEKTSLGTNNYQAFQTAFNQELLNIGYRSPADNAPWIRIPLVGGSDTDWIGAVNSAMRDNDILFFNRARITDIINEGGQTYAILRYDYANKNEPDSCVYNTETDTLLVKFDTGNGYFVYAPVPTTSDMIVSVTRNESGFVRNASLKKATIHCNVAYPNTIPTSFTFTIEQPKTYWVYDGVMQQFNNDGTLATTIEMQETLKPVIKEKEVEYLTDLAAEYKDGFYTVTIPKNLFQNSDNVLFRIYAKEGSSFSAVTQIANTTITWQRTNADEDSYLQNLTLQWQDENTVTDDAGTMVAPQNVQERSLRQKIKISKDIQTLPEPKVVWYCKNCGYENTDGTGACGYCQTTRTTEETKTIRYAHDTYSAVHSENLDADGSDGGILDWLTQLLNGGVKDQSAKDVPEFRFKAYLKSNLERLYRNPDGEIVWMDRNGNVMTPQYQDTNGDGNYDTFTWKYADAYEGKSVDWPEKDKVSDDGSLQSSNVQKIYTKVEHNTDSDTTSHRANNVWSTYLTPGRDATDEVAEKAGYSTSERVDGAGNNGEASGLAIRGSDSLYSYSGTNEDVAKSDRLNDKPNTEYIRILETTLKTMEDGAGATREVEMYNYEKFFDAIHAANLDIWDDDMHSSFTGNSMKNYPGQHWFETFYEKYQRDDADPNHTLENTDGADKDNTAGGDRDTSFKPFRWIREKVFGDRTDYEKYPAEHNGVNTETSMSTSDFARANAEASDAVRQFATKWYLEQEAAKLMKDNGVGENIAKAEDGTLQYDEAIYDEALFNAIAKSYNYLKPFYVYDLDTVYSVEWDSAANGGSDKDYTTLSVDLDDDAEVYNVSSYLPYGVYVIVEQQPMRRDDKINDWDNRSYTIEKPKEVILPSLYDGAESNDTTDNYDPHYSYDPAQTSEDQAKTDNYLIRFGEEWSDDAPNAGQDERQYVIRAHGYDGDYEVYKYGLDIDLMNPAENRYGGGLSDGFAYAGWKQVQEDFDPLKDTYNTAHRGKDGAETTPPEDGGNDGAGYDGAEKTNGADTANGSSYNGTAVENRYFYGSVSEDKGSADNVMFKGGATDDNNVSGMQWKDDVISMTGELTAYDEKYAPMLVPWTVTAPADIHAYDSKNFSGYADVNERDGFYTTFLRVNKTDSETGEYILHDDAIFGLYAGSRYQSFEEIEKDSKLIKDEAEREKFLNQFKPGDAKFYLQDTQIEGTREFLMAMGAKDITPVNKSSDIPAAGVAVKELCTGIVPKGTPVCVESEQIMLTDSFGNRTGQMTVYTTNNDVKAAGEEDAADKAYRNQNTGYFVTPQPVGAGVYVLAELKAPNGYARSKPVAYEVYSDKTQYYVDGDMYQKVTAVRYDGNLLEDVDYEN